MFLINTDVLSAMRRRERHPNMVGWISRQRATDLHVSVVSVGEIEKGIIRQERRDPEFARDLSAWLDDILVLYGDRILPVDVPTARRWGRLCGVIGHEGPDLLIAATALERGLSVVTRNVGHFQPTGVAVVDPSAESAV